MKAATLLAALVSTASCAQAAIEWTAGGWHTIAAYDAENQLIARALASEANYASDVTKRLCVDRTFAIQELLTEGVSRQLSYYSWGCEMPSAGGQCATREPRGETCTSYDVSILLDLKTNGVRVLNIVKHGSVGGGDRGTPPSIIPTTRPPSTPESAPPTTTTPTSTSTSTPAPTTTTPVTTTPTPTTSIPTVATVAETTGAASSTDDLSTSSRGSQSKEESPITSTKPSAAVPANAKPTPAPTKSNAVSRTVACAAVSLAVVAASLV